MDDPQARVLAYVTGYFEMSEALYYRVTNDGDFEAWERGIDKLEAEHCTPGAAALDRYSVSSPPKHDPAKEQVLEVDANGDEALVVTQCGDYHFFDYTVVRVDGNWRITHIQQTATHPNAPLVRPEELAAHLASASESASFHPLEEGEDPSNSLFEDGRNIELERDAGVLSVRRVGELNITSGVIGVLDLAYDGYDLMPLERKVAPGRYPVEVSTIFGRNAALRVLFGDPDAVVAWHPANVPEGGHAFGVDAGNLAVFDLASFAALNVRRKEALYEGSVMGPANDPMAQMLTMVHEDDGVVAASGWGDGAYPAHWGVSADGQPVVLLLDFLVACTWPGELVELELTEARVGERVTAEGYESMLISAQYNRLQDRAELLIPAACQTPFWVIGADGEVVTHASRMHCTQQETDLLFELSEEVQAAFPLTLRFELTTGYKN